jgi:hypothetical protein
MNQKALNRQKNERLTLRKLNIENTESQNAKKRSKGDK